MFSYLHTATCPVTSGDTINHHNSLQLFFIHQHSSHQVQLSLSLNKMLFLFLLVKHSSSGCKNLTILSVWHSLSLSLSQQKTLFGVSLYMKWNSSTVPLTFISIHHGDILFGYFLACQDFRPVHVHSWSCCVVHSWFCVCPIDFLER